MAHTPSKMSIEAVQDEVRQAWTKSYSPEATQRAITALESEPAAYRISHLLARLFFRGIYFPQKGAWAWLRLIFSNRTAIAGLARELVFRGVGSKANGERLEFERGMAVQASGESAD